MQEVAETCGAISYCCTNVWEFVGEVV
ncbi:hypothetical protein FN961_13485 [Shewanella hanedai]|uniref:Uncharacterized protein n=1 Tax=Shewanella hanedai TaxID=25 RepID=A0A553JND9_SHEHA|nr:hypothetical protein FN961_13485 [Shewanella hanedai]